MKHIGKLFLMAALTLFFTACTKPYCSTTVDYANMSSSKILVAYYSYSGNTKAAAEYIAEITGGDLFEIKTNHTYPAEYKEMTAQAKKEIAEGFLPLLTSQVPNMEQYKVVFVGSPDWWGTFAPAYRSFLTAYNFEGKKVAPFFTYGSAGMQNCEEDTKKLLTKATLLPAAAFKGATIKESKAEIAAWLKQIGF